MRISDWSSDVCSSDLIADKFRPGHADYTYWKKYGIRDYRGGGRSSARETAMRVPAGGIARKVLDHVLPVAVSIRGAPVQMGPHRIERGNRKRDAVAPTPFWCPDAEAAAACEDSLPGGRKAGTSTATRPRG